MSSYSQNTKRSHLETNKKNELNFLAFYCSLQRQDCLSIYMWWNGIEKEESKNENGNGNLKRSHAWINALYSHLMQKKFSAFTVVLLFLCWISRGVISVRRLWICCISKNRHGANYRYSAGNSLYWIIMYIRGTEKKISTHHWNPVIYEVSIKRHTYA